MSGKAKQNAKQKAKQQAEIIPPDKNGDGDSLNQDDGTARAGTPGSAHLRMPPLIDNAGSWRARLALLGAPLSAFGAAIFRNGKNLLSGLLYRATLLILVGTALGVTGYGIWQARHMSLPQFDSFWHRENTVSDSPTHMDAAAVAPMPLLTQDIKGDGAADFQPSGELVDLQRQLQALNKFGETTTETMPDTMSGTVSETVSGDMPPNTDSAPQAGEALTALQAQYADLQAKHAALLAAQKAEKAQAAQNAQDAQTAQAAAQNDLLARAALSDLLLRLDSGAAYDDLLEGGALAQILRRSEWTLLALYADSGIPTRPALLTRFELWVANAAAPAMASPRAAHNGFYRAVLDWLRTRGDGLVTVRAAPLATADGDIAMIANALERGRHDEAAWRIGALLRRMEGDRSLNHPDMASLQLLYDDMRAAAEIAPMLAALRDDYMAGARP